MWGNERLYGESKMRAKRQYSHHIWRGQAVYGPLKFRRHGRELEESVKTRGVMAALRMDNRGSRAETMSTILNDYNY